MRRRKEKRLWRILWKDRKNPSSQELIGEKGEQQLTEKEKEIFPVNLSPKLLADSEWEEELEPNEEEIEEEGTPNQE